MVATAVRLPPNSIFICYRRYDSEEIVDRVYGELTKEFGQGAIFRDVDNIPPGVDFPTYIQDSLRHCPVVLVFVGREWLVDNAHGGKSRLNDPDDHVRIEIETALSLPGVRVIPVLVRRGEMPERNQLPESLHPLCRRNGVAVRSTGYDYKQDVEHLISVLRKTVADVLHERKEAESHPRREPSAEAHAPTAFVSDAPKSHGAKWAMAAVALLLVCGGVFFYFQRTSHPEQTGVGAESRSTAATATQATTPAASAASEAAQRTAALNKETDEKEVMRGAFQNKPNDTATKLAEVTPKPAPLAPPAPAPVAALAPATEQTYKGKVGPYEATFKIKIEPGGRVTGSYTMPVDKGLVMRLEGQNPEGQLILDEYTNSRLSSHIKLNLKKSGNEIRWEGTMYNTPPDNRVFPISISRAR